MLDNYAFTPNNLRNYLLPYIGQNMGVVYYTDSRSDTAITIGNVNTTELKIEGIEMNIPLFPNTQEVSQIDQNTSSFENFWEIGFYLWEDSDEGRLKLYEILTVLTRCLSGVRIYRCSAGISNGLPYSECYTVTFVQTCSVEKERIT